MKKYISIILSLAMIVCTINVQIAFAADAGSYTVYTEVATGAREAVNFNANWHFYRGTPSGNPGNSGYDDIAWEHVSLPHSIDYVTYDNMEAYIGEAWYRKSFAMPESYKGKRIFINFGAVMQSAAVYINGRQIGTHNGGFMGFTFDITDYVTYSDELVNLIAIKLNTGYNNNWMPAQASVDFQYHGGIYRDVSLTVTDNVHVTDSLYADVEGSGGVFIHSDIAESYDSSEGNIGISNIKKIERKGIATDFTGDVKFYAGTHVQNDGGTEKNVKLKYELISPDNTVVWSDTTDAVKIKAAEGMTIKDTGSLTGAKLWHPYSPNMYTLRTSVFADDVMVDEYVVKTGFRKIIYTPVDTSKKTKGTILINDEPFDGLGTNVHQEIGMTGFAVSKEAAREEVRMIKDAGFDMVRLAHYPYQEAYLDACDEYGILVQEPVTGWQQIGNETAQNSSYEEARHMIRRDRNHPSIALWELCINEANIAEGFSRNMVKIAREEFPTKQMITTGGKTRSALSYDAAYVHSGNNVEQSGKPNLYFEYGDWQYGGYSSSTRYLRWDLRESKLRQAVANFQTALDRSQASLANAGYYWVWQDYSGFGTANPDDGADVATKTSTYPTACGIVDFYRVPKYAYYYAKSQRDPSLTFTGLDGVDNGAMIYIANHWFDDTNTDIPVYTNCDEVRLYADDNFTETIAVKTSPDEKKSAAQQGSSYALTTKYAATAHPPFTFTGISHSYKKITAVGYINGIESTRYSVTDPRAMTPSKIELELNGTDNVPLVADGGDKRLVKIKLTDDKGNIVSNVGTVSSGIDFGVPSNSKKVSVSVEGDAWILGGDTVNLNKEKTAEVSLRGGETSIWVVSGRTADNDIKITAECGNIKSDAITISSVKADGFDAENIEVEDPDIDRCLARLGEASASSGTAKSASDGDTDTAWVADSSSANEYWCIDLGEKFNISDIEIIWNGSSAYRYKLLYSANGSKWNQIADMSDNKSSSDSNTFNARGKTARFIKLLFTADSASPFAIKEIHINGKAASTVTETIVSDGKSAEWTAGSGVNAMNGTDGNPSSYASASNSDSGNIWTVNLDGIYIISYVDISWEKSSAHKYIVEFSADGNTWSEIADNSSNIVESSQTSHTLAKKELARYVRITSCADTEPMSFSMFKVFGVPVGEEDNISILDGVLCYADRKSITTDKEVVVYKALYDGSNVLQSVSSETGSRFDLSDVSDETVIYIWTKQMQPVTVPIHKYELGTVTELLTDGAIEVADTIENGKWIPQQGKWLSGLGTLVGIDTVNVSPNHSSTKSVKITEAGFFQAISVEKDTDYTLTFDIYITDSYPSGEFFSGIYKGKSTNGNNLIFSCAHKINKSKINQWQTVTMDFRWTNDDGVATLNFFYRNGYDGINVDNISIIEDN